MPVWPVPDPFLTQEPHLFCEHGWTELKIEHVIKGDQKQAKLKTPHSLTAQTKSPSFSLAN